MITSSAVKTLVELALIEDIGAGDVTSRWFIPENSRSRAIMRAREPLVLAGTEVVQLVCTAVDPALTISSIKPDGFEAETGDTLLVIEGPTRSLLTAERTALNFLQRLSGVATRTREYVRAIEGTTTRLLDTRKTTPGYRQLEKAAVLAGGGTNHRTGLYDMVLVKDNHLAAAPDADLGRILREIRREHPGMKIEFEADTLEQVARFAALPEIDIILLDNMTPGQIREALGHRRAGLAFEASGGIGLATIRSYAETGVDFISVGAVTHSATAVDIGLDHSDNGAD